MLRRCFAVLLVASLALLGAPAAGAAPVVGTAHAAGAGSTASTVPTQITGMSITAPTHFLARSQLAVMTVRLHLVDPDGVVPRTGASFERFWSCPCVLIQPSTSAGAPFRASPQASGMRVVSLALASGTPQDGVWRGSTIVGAADAGIWRPTLLDAGDFVVPGDPDPLMGSMVRIPEAQAATSFNLRGYDWPVLSVRIPTTVTPVYSPFVLRGAALTSRSRQPLPGLRLLAATGAPCTFLDHAPGAPTRTGPTGAWALASTDPAPTWCVWWAPDRNGFPVNLVTATRVHVSATITARVSATHVHAGGGFTVSGVMRPVFTGWALPWVVLEVYRLGAWRAVRTTQVLSTGAYRMSYVANAGTNRFRVRVPSTSSYVGTSARFTVYGV